MCDFSLEHLASRPAKVGDQLVTTKFGGMYTTGFCAIGEPSLAVCIKPGTELAFEREIECESLWLKRRTGSQVARFRRVNEDRKCVHHDALELPSGKVVLLTRLLVGQRATVLQLPVEERDTERRVTEMAQPAIRNSAGRFNGLLKKLEGATKGVTLMTDKSSFTPDEWKLLLESPMAAGIAISAAEPSGLWGF